MILRLAGAVSVALVTSSVPLAGIEAQPPSLDTSVLQSGDLVFREGVGWRSTAVVAASRFRLTHVGIVERVGDSIFVIDAEPPEDGRPGVVRRVTLAQFSSPRDAKRTVAYRLTGLSGQQRLSREARRFVGRPFDDAFDLDDDSALYCTELVWRSLATTGEQFRPQTTHIRLGVLEGDYLTPMDLLISARRAGLGPKPLSLQN